MRFLIWIVIIAFTSGKADAQVPSGDAKLPNANVKLTPRIESSSPRRESVLHAPLPSRNFGGHVYHGRLTWERGRWHHTTRKGRFGWWWDVGGTWYYYPEQIEGPPNYVSDNSLPEDATTEPVAQATPSHRVYLYHPGDLKGVPYDTLEQCTNAVQQAGGVDICVMK